MENFFGLLKQEIYYGHTFNSYDELKQTIKQWIHYYNTKRVKKKLGWLSPIEYRFKKPKQNYCLSIGPNLWVHDILCLTFGVQYKPSVFCFSETICSLKLRKGLKNKSHVVLEISNNMTYLLKNFLIFSVINL